MQKTSIIEQGLRGAGDWSIHGLYGINLASDFSFASRLSPKTGPADLMFTCVSSPPREARKQAELVYASPPYPDETGESEVYLYRSDDCLIVRFTGISEFFLWPDRILCHPLAAEYRRRLSGYSREEADRYHRMLIEIYLLGYVFACWLEWQGIPTLHASAVVVDERAVAFLSSGGGGKSSSAVALMQGGYPLLTDDILPIQHGGEAYLGLPGYPQMRMWPGQAKHFLGHYEDLDLVHPAVSKRQVPVEESGLGAFCEVSRPLVCLYLPQRRDPAAWGTGIKIEPVSRREAVMTLIGSSFIPPVLEALGLHPHRLGFFARMALRVPVRRVVYPNGFEHLPRVRDAILADLAGFPPVSRGA